MAAPPLLFRADGGRALGLGHWVRCRAMADTWPVPVTPWLATTADDADLRIASEVFGEGWTIRPLPAGLTPADEADAIAAIAAEAGTLALVADLASMAVKAAGRLPPLHAALSGRGLSVLSLEDFECGPPSARLTVIPYPTLPGLAPADGPALAVGPDFYIFPKAFRDVIAQPPPRPSRPTVLACIGGSDPLGLSAMAARAFCQLSLDMPEMEATVILGSGAGEALEAEVRRQCGDRIRVERAVADMGRRLASAHLAVTGEGLVKFEAAAVGTPSIIVSQYDHDSAMLRAFLALGASMYLGPAGQVGDRHLAQAVRHLLQDRLDRDRMAAAGRRAFDGHGILRIAQRSREFLPA